MRGFIRGQPRSADLPLVVEMDGVRYIDDGHHRLLAARLTGRPIEVELLVLERDLTEATKAEALARVEHMPVVIEDADDLELDLTLFGFDGASDMFAADVPADFRLITIARNLGVTPTAETIHPRRLLLTLRPTQPIVYRRTVEWAIINAPDSLLLDDRPILVTFAGEHWIMDGHHRISAAILLDTTIPVVRYDLSHLTLPELEAASQRVLDDDLRVVQEAEARELLQPGDGLVQAVAEVAAEGGDPLLLPTERFFGTVAHMIDPDFTAQHVQGALPAVERVTMRGWFGGKPGTIQVADRLVATQAFVNVERVEAYLAAPGSSHPILVELEGALYVADGHHKIAAALLRGESTIDAHVLRPEQRGGLRGLFAFPDPLDSFAEAPVLAGTPHDHPPSAVAGRMYRGINLTEAELAQVLRTQRVGRPGQDLFFAQQPGPALRYVDDNQLWGGNPAEKFKPFGVLIEARVPPRVARYRYDADLEMYQPAEDEVSWQDITRLWVYRREASTALVDLAGEVHPELQVWTTFRVIQINPHQPQGGLRGSFAFPDPLDSDLPVPLTPYVQEVTAAQDDRWKVRVDDTTTLDALHAQAQAKIEALVEEAAVAVRVTEDRLMDILRAGEIRPGVLTGTGKWDASADFRQEIETALFRTPLEATDRPVYGYLTTDPDLRVTTHSFDPHTERELAEVLFDPESFTQVGITIADQDDWDEAVGEAYDQLKELDPLTGYGGVAIRLRRASVGPRTTITGGDTGVRFSHRAIEGGLIPSPLLAPSFRSFLVGSEGSGPNWNSMGIPLPTDPLLLTSVDDLTDYFEAQVHGGPITVADIEEVVFAREPDDETIAALAEARIPWRETRTVIAMSLTRGGRVIAVRPQVEGELMRLRRLLAQSVPPEDFDDELRIWRRDQGLERDALPTSMTPAQVEAFKDRLFGAARVSGIVADDVMFHGTTTRDLPGILRDGLQGGHLTGGGKRGTRNYAESEAAVYATWNEWIARNHAVRVAGEGVEIGFTRLRPPAGRPVVVQIRVIDTGQWVPDPDDTNSAMTALVKPTDIVGVRVVQADGTLGPLIPAEQLKQALEAGDHLDAALARLTVKPERPRDIRPSTKPSPVDALLDTLDRGVVADKEEDWRAADFGTEVPDRLYRGLAFTREGLADFLERRMLTTATGQPYATGLPLRERNLAARDLELAAMYTANTVGYGSPGGDYGILLEIAPTPAMRKVMAATRYDPTQRKGPLGTRAGSGVMQLPAEDVTFDAVTRAWVVRYDYVEATDEEEEYLRAWHIEPVPEALLHPSGSPRSLTVLPDLPDAVADDLRLKGHVPATEPLVDLSAVWRVDPTFHGRVMRPLGPGQVDLLRAAPTVTLAASELGALVATQPGVVRSTVAKLLIRPSRSVLDVIVVQAEGVRYIFDGHHRVLAAWLQQQPLAVRFLDLDARDIRPSTKGDPWTVSRGRDPRELIVHIPDPVALAQIRRDGWPPPEHKSYWGLRSKANIVIWPADTEWMFVAGAHVQEGLRRQGLGRAMYRRALEEAVARGYKGLLSMMRSEDADALWTALAAEPDLLVTRRDGGRNYLQFRLAADPTPSTKPDLGAVVREALAADLKIPVATLAGTDPRVLAEAAMRVAKTLPAAVRRQLLARTTNRAVEGAVTAVDQIRGSVAAYARGVTFPDPEALGPNEFWHGTSDTAAEAIAKTGLVEPRGDRRGNWVGGPAGQPSDPTRVYLTTSYQDAVEHARGATIKAHPTDTRATAEGGPTPVIVRVRVEAARLLPDEDTLLQFVDEDAADPFAGEAPGQHTPAAAARLVTYLETATGRRVTLRGLLARGVTSTNDIDLDFGGPAPQDLEAVLARIGFRYVIDKDLGFARFTKYRNATDHAIEVWEPRDATLGFPDEAFADPRRTPSTPLEQQTRDAVIRFAELQTRPVPEGFAYYSIDDLLVQHGRFYRSAPLTPAEVAYLDELIGRETFPIKQCYSNSQSLLLEARVDAGMDLRYHEGVVPVVMGTDVLPIRHAWLTLNGKVVDVTLRDKALTNEVAHAATRPARRHRRAAAADRPGAGPVRPGDRSGPRHRCVGQARRPRPA